MITRTGEYNEETKTIDICCTECGKEFKIPATREQFNRICSGRECIQEILPNATPEERELFLSGFCNCFWNAMGDDE